MEELYWFDETTLSDWASDAAEEPQSEGEDESELVQRIRNGDETIYEALSRHPAVRWELVRPGEAAEKDRRIPSPPIPDGPAEDLDGETTDRLVAYLLRWVLSIAEEYTGRGLQLVDLVQAGNVGLLKAIETFEIRSGDSFSAHAPSCIRQEITRALARQAGGEAMTREQIAELLDDEAAPGGETEPAFRLREPPSAAAVRRCLRELGKALARTIGEAQPAAAQPAAAAAGEGVPVVEEDLLDELCDMVDKMLLSLTAREEMVLRLRFGIGEGTGHTLKEVAGWFEVGTSRIGQLQSQALRQLCHRHHPAEVRELLRQLRRLPES